MKKLTLMASLALAFGMSAFAEPASQEITIQVNNTSHEAIADPAKATVTYEDGVYTIGSFMESGVPVQFTIPSNKADYTVGKRFNLTLTGDEFTEYSDEELEWSTWCLLNNYDGTGASYALDWITFWKEQNYSVFYDPASTNEPFHISLCAYGTLYDENDNELWTDNLFFEFDMEDLAGIFAEAEPSTPEPTIVDFADYFMGTDPDNEESIDAVENPEWATNLTLVFQGELALNKAATAPVTLSYGGKEVASITLTENDVVPWGDDAGGFAEGDDDVDPGMGVSNVVTYMVLDFGKELTDAGAYTVAIPEGILTLADGNLLGAGKVTFTVEKQETSEPEPTIVDFEDAFQGSMPSNEEPIDLEEYPLGAGYLNIAFGGELALVEGAETPVSIAYNGKEVAKVTLVEDNIVVDGKDDAGVLTEGDDDVDPGMTAGAITTIVEIDFDKTLTEAGEYTVTFPEGILAYTDGSLLGKGTVTYTVEEPKTPAVEVPETTGNTEAYIDTPWTGGNSFYSYNMDLTKNEPGNYTTTNFMYSGADVTVTFDVQALKNSENGEIGFTSINGSTDAYPYLLNKDGEKSTCYAYDENGTKVTIEKPYFFNSADYCGVGLYSEEEAEEYGHNAYMYFLIANATSDYYEVWFDLDIDLSETSVTPEPVVVPDTKGNSIAWINTPWTDNSYYGYYMDVTNDEPGKYTTTNFMYSGADVTVTFDVEALKNSEEGYVGFTSINGSTDSSMYLLNADGKYVYGYAYNEDGTEDKIWAPYFFNDPDYSYVELYSEEDAKEYGHNAFICLLVRGWVGDNKSDYYQVWFDIDVDLSDPIVEPEPVVVPETKGNTVAYIETPWTTENSFYTYNMDVTMGEEGTCTTTNFMYSGADVTVTFDTEALKNSEKGYVGFTSINGTTEEYPYLLNEDGDYVNCYAYNEDGTMATIVTPYFFNLDDYSYIELYTEEEAEEYGCNAYVCLLIKGWNEDGKSSDWYEVWFDVNVDLTETGVQSITLGGDAEYYDLRGIRVANPEKGIFIMRQGDKVTKIAK